MSNWEVVLLSTEVSSYRHAACDRVQVVMMAMNCLEVHDLIESRTLLVHLTPIPPRIGKSAHGISLRHPCKC